jgi:hypothetical protein
MSAMFERIRPGTGGLIAFAILLAIGSASSAVAAETLIVNIDESRLLRIPERTATLVVGNPLIADAALQPGGIMVLTGKGYGATNLIALDRSGAVLMEHAIQVEAPRHDGLVTVYRGIQRETYSCTPECQPRVGLGDTPRYFSDRLTQTTTLSDMAAAHARVGQDADRDKKIQENRDSAREWERTWDRILDRALGR